MTNFQNGLIVTVAVMAGVFVVLILFYVIINIMTRLFPYKQEDQ